MNKYITLISLLLLAANAISFAHEGQYAWYTFNEGPTGNKCKTEN